MSPTKQLAVLEESNEPLFYRDFQDGDGSMDDETRRLFLKCQDLADGIGIIPFAADESAELLAQGQLTSFDLHRFQRPWAVAEQERFPPKSRRLRTLQWLQDIVKQANDLERLRSQESTWTENIHKPLMENVRKESLAADTTCHVNL